MSLARRTERCLPEGRRPAYISRSLTSAGQQRDLYPCAQCDALRSQLRSRARGGGVRVHRRFLYYVFHIFDVHMAIESLLTAYSAHPVQFDALRSQLGMRAGEVAMRFKELGATATPIKITGGVARWARSKIQTVPAVIREEYALRAVFGLEWHSSSRRLAIGRQHRFLLPSPSCDLTCTQLSFPLITLLFLDSAAPARTHGSTMWHCCPPMLGTRWSSALSTTLSPPSRPAARAAGDENDCSGDDGEGRSRNVIES